MQKGNKFGADWTNDKHFFKCFSQNGGKSILADLGVQEAFYVPHGQVDLQVPSLVTQGHGVCEMAFQSVNCLQCHHEANLGQGLVWEQQLPVGVSSFQHIAAHGKLRERRKTIIGKNKAVQQLSLRPSGQDLFIYKNCPSIAEFTLGQRNLPPNLHHFDFTKFFFFFFFIGKVFFQPASSLWLYTDSSGRGGCVTKRC